MNNSPWLTQLVRTREVVQHTKEIETDVCIIGGGISGITTAYFLLSQTDKKIVLLEANRVAHGATGHNAGQITSYFEKPLVALVEQYGFEKAIAAQKAIEEDARVLLQKIFIETGIDIPYSEFIGYEGLVNEEQVHNAFDNLYIRARSEVLAVRKVLLEKRFAEKMHIPEIYKDLYTVVENEDIIRVLEVVHTQVPYIGALPFLSGCMNSAVFSEKLASYLLEKYKDHFSLFEETKAEEVLSREVYVHIKTNRGLLHAKEVVLCTNGFEGFHIQADSGVPLEKDFHQNVFGKVGYMGAYVTPMHKQPFASIYNTEKKEETEPYFYVTRRPYSDAIYSKHNLVCIGGPEYFLPDCADYDNTHGVAMRIRDMLDTFSLQNFKERDSMDFYWHGLMGYTKSGMRIIGREKSAPRMLYNLGCNGVGILTSIYGAHKIAKILAGEIFPPSVFDPQ